MIGQLDSAVYLAGEVKGTLLSSLYLGYPNSVYHYGMANTISFPLDNAQVLLSSQSDAQVDIIGYRNNIIDSAFNIYAGEFCSYSNDWYLITGNNNGNKGVILQKNNTDNKEHLMMGESTNKVLSDIVDALDKIFAYLQTIQANYIGHTHNATSFTAPTSNPNPPLLPAPDPTITTKVDADQSYINNGVNLAGANYSPLTSEVE